MFGITLVKPFTDWQPHVNENEDATEHVHSVQTGDREIAGKICAVRWQRHGRALHVFLFDLRDFVGGRNVEKVRPLHRGIGWIGVDWIERDSVFIVPTGTLSSPCGHSPGCASSRKKM